ncbi:hypothetical protein CBL_08553 [Carabus blaptoides fortunei]
MVEEDCGMFPKDLHVYVTGKHAPSYRGLDQSYELNAGENSTAAMGVVVGAEEVKEDTVQRNLLQGFTETPKASDVQVFEMPNDVRIFKPSSSGNVDVAFLKKLLRVDLFPIDLVILPCVHGDSNVCAFSGGGSYPAIAMFGGVICKI